MMRSNFTKIQLAFCIMLIQKSVIAQCGASASGGSASNMFTQIRNSTNPVAADKNLNTIVFIHRNNASAFGGNSGHLRYDVSINAGSTWTNDQGLLNPINSNLARYPNLAIYNPSANVNPANAYISYMAATINSVNSTWNGVVTGVRQLNGSGNTENYNQPVLSPQLIPHSIVKGAPGVYWAIDALFNGSTITGFAIYKGTWNSSTNDIVWVTNYSITPSFAAAGVVGDYNIAFDPSGNIGWFSFLSRLSPGPSNNSYYPIFYKTSNGGLTWSGPFQVDLDNFNCITANMVSPNVSTTNFEHDLVVDINGNPHMLTTICNGNNGNSVLYNNWHHMFDITQINGVWAAYDVANVNAGRGTWGVSPNIATMDMAPQAARSSDGTKLFFTWSDNANYAIGAANLTPNMFAKAFDVVQNKWTTIKDFSSCNPALNGKILFPHLAPEVLEPGLGIFKLASVYGEYTVPNDPIQISNFKFLDNATFASTEFTVNNQAATVSIQQGSSFLLCPGAAQIINIPGGNYGQILWSNGSTSNAASISTSSVNLYIVTVQQNCVIGIDSIAVTNMTLSTSQSNFSVCPGETSTLSVSGNANSYTWNPGTLSGSLAVVNPTTTTVYSLSAGGGNNCVSTQTLSVFVYGLPTLNINGPDSICIGESATLIAIGATNYSWSTGGLGPNISTSPTSNSSYTLYGTDANLCSNTQTFYIEVLPLPTITVVSTRSIICRGETVTLTVSGASTYSWTNPSTVTSIVIVSPTITTNYSVVGTSSVGCKQSSTFTQSVSACTGFELSNNRTDLLYVFPNPSAGNFTIKSNQVIELKLFNELGQVIRYIELNEENQMQFTINSLASGIYFITGKVEDQKFFQKIIVSP